MASKVAILKTLIYSDIFDFPLTKEDLWRFLVVARSVDRTSFEKALNEFPPVKWEHKWEHRKGFYFLSGREKIVSKRIKRKKESQKKLNLAGKVIQKLSLVPTVLFVGISGGLALENSDEKDDIDLFVITSKNSLWITRLILVLLLILMGQYRGRGNPPLGGESNKICLNMLIDEKGLMLERSRQNLYTAHEIVQLKPIFDRNSTYNKFLSANKWVTKFLPNGIVIKKLSNEVIKNKKLNYPITDLLNYLAKAIQLWYMKEHRTRETVGDHFLAFHPFEYKDHVLKEYNKRLKQYEV